VEKTKIDSRPAHDPACYLCAGNTRANGETNPAYASTFVFDNDFAAIPANTPTGEFKDGLLHARAEVGTCRVICFSPRHDLTIAEMSVEELKAVVIMWMEQYAELGAMPFVNHVQIFENKGALMGCSNEHPHGQIWAQESVPVEVEQKQRQQQNYHQETGNGMLETYLAQELAAKDRVLFENDHMVVLVPFWAIWPFEAMILPKRRMARITEMTEVEQMAFAESISWLTIRYDNLFQTSFPYSSGIHQAPTDGKSHDEWHWHMTFYPPLLRSATVKKFMVGYELFANPQRDITPEWAAKSLRELPGIHFKKQG
jgi:UDPglucose--hexose-1-phosphate uridylyltransferase